MIRFSKKYLPLFAILLLSSLLLSGCSLLGEKNKEEENADKLENVEIIDSENNRADDEEEDDVPTLFEQPKPTEEKDKTETALPTDNGDMSVGSATSSEGATIVSYSYEVSGGKLRFEWKVRADNNGYPKAVLTQNTDGVIKVSFPSLQKDFVAKEEGTSTLGSQLPELNWKPTAAGSEYQFNYSVKKSYELKSEDRGDEGKFIVLEVAM